MAEKLVKIAERNFVVDTSQERVWGLLGPALMNSPIGMEKLEVIDEFHINAEAEIKFAFIPIIAKIKIIFLELEEPRKMVVALNTEALKGLLRLNQRVTIALNPQDKEHTEVKCEALAEKGNPLVFSLVAGKVRSTAAITLEGIEQTLRRLA